MTNHSMTLRGVLNPNGPLTRRTVYRQFNTITEAIKHLGRSEVLKLINQSHKMNQLNTARIRMYEKAK